MIGKDAPGVPIQELIQRAIQHASSAFVVTSPKPSLWVHCEGAEAPRFPRRWSSRTEASTHCANLTEQEEATEAAEIDRE